MSTMSLVFIIFVVSEMMLHRYGRQLSHLPTKTVKSEEDEIIDCIDIYDSPSFRNPLLKHHKIKIFSGANDNTTLYTIHRTWRKSVFCPNGTIPVSRNQANIAKNEKEIANSWSNYHPPAPFYSKDDSSNEWEYAVAYASAFEWYYTGTRGRIFIWKPKVEPNEMSFSYISVAGVGVDGTGEYYVRAGWRISPLEYGDARPRFAVYRSGSDCFNLCSGFVQTNSGIHIDWPFAHESVPGGTHYAVLFEIKRDDYFNWVVSASNIVIGYYPHELFKPFIRGDALYYGGAVTNKKPGGKHTYTEMGSGQFPKPSPESGIIDGIYSYDLEGGVHDADNPLNYIITKQNCYAVKYLGQQSDGANQISYGGLGGQNPTCTDGANQISSGGSGGQNPTCTIDTIYYVIASFMYVLIYQIYTSTTAILWDRPMILVAYIV